MTDIFLSYRNRPIRRQIVKRLGTLLRNYELKVWWDYGLEAGIEFEPQILQRLQEAKVVVVLWCAESIVSEWVYREAIQAGERLLPVRLQNVTPPEPFAKRQCLDLTHWDGSISASRFQKFVEVLSKALGRDTMIETDTFEDLESLAPINPLPYEPLSETGGPEFEAWIAQARPILAKFKPLYAEVRKRQLPVREFLNGLQALVAELPPLPAPTLHRDPSPVHRARLLETLREHISDELHQGHPIPDSYRIEPIVSELCIRPGIIVTCWSRRQGFGDLDTGMVVPLEFQNPG
jgi:hypothetical protein